MNCRRVEKLIPLYVEGDLASGIADRLTSHLDWCGRCNWLADEYKESQSWLRTNEPPEFDSAYLDSFKAAVLKQVEEGGTRPLLLVSLVQQWSRRQLLALSAALLIIFGALVFYIYRVGIRVNPPVLEAVEKPPSGDAAAPNSPQPVPATGTAPGADLSKRHHATRHASTKSQNGNQLAQEQIVERPLMPETNRMPASRTAEAEAANALPGSSDDPREMLRIELQTADPNIRIIWFAPKEVESPQTNQ